MQCGTGKKAGNTWFLRFRGRTHSTIDSELAPSRKKTHMIYKVHGSSFKYFATKYINPEDLSIKDKL